MLELVVEFHPEQGVLEVLHKLLVVNSTSAGDISHQGKCEHFAVVEPEWWEHLQALDILERLQEAFITLIELTEDSE